MGDGPGDGTRLLDPRAELLARNHTLNEAAAPVAVLFSVALGRGISSATSAPIQRTSRLKASLPVTASQEASERSWRVSLYRSFGGGP
jgi:hypothetical protein